MLAVEKNRLTMRPIQMKQSLFAATVVALALSAGSALAADLPSHKAPPPYIPPPPPPPMWTGFYVGLNAGGTWADSNNTRTIGVPLAAAPTFQNEALGAALLATSNSLGLNNGGGFIGGGQIGYNWQFYNSFVAGIEADIQGIASTSRNGNSFGAVAPFPTELMIGTISVRENLDYLGTVRGRVGYLITPSLLVFGSGGLAYGGVRSSTALFQTDTTPGIAGCFFCGPYFAAGTFSDTRVGWTAGGGLEWMFWPNWSAKVEYLYYDLGSVSYPASPLVSIFTATAAPFTAGSVAWAAAAQTTSRFNGNVVRVGVNYHFNWGSAPVVAKY
jgi:outer membrane immunogenic protein